jgi:hypothetical protein
LSSLPPFTFSNSPQVLKFHLLPQPPGFGVIFLSSASKIASKSQHFPSINFSLTDYRHTVSTTTKAAPTATPIRFFEAERDFKNRDKNYIPPNILGLITFLIFGFAVFYFIFSL